MEEKSNEITAIPKVLESIEIKGQAVTIDAMGTQTAIVGTIRKRRADYVLAVKGNQGNLETDIRQYFEDQQLCEDIELFSRAVRGHWAVESMHWHLDVTFKEDANTTLDKIAA